MKYVRRRGVGEVLLVLEEVIELSNHHGVGEVLLVLEEVIELSNHHGVGETSHGEVHRWPCDDERSWT